MNERIKELADRLWRVHPNDIDAMGLKTRTEFYEHELKKFAELIVKECMTKVSEWDMGIDDPVGATDNISVVARDMVAEIKQHFGVEE